MPTKAIEANNLAGASQPLLRQTNLRLVLSIIFAADEPVSRAGIAGQTGLTRSTVSRLVDELLAGGFIVELAPTTAGRGRPAVPLAPAKGTLVSLGLEVNVDHLCARVVDLRGNVVAEEFRYQDNAAAPPAEVLASLRDIAHQCLAEVRARGMRPVASVVGLPGVVDQATGSVLWAPNLGWTNVEITPLLDDIDGLHPALGNEADLAAYTVATPVPGKPGELSDFVYVSSEVGIGGAIIREGEVRSGEHGWAGEIGHVMVNPYGPQCACGAIGCLEQYAGRHALLRAAGLPITATMEQLLTELEAGNQQAHAAAVSAGQALGRVLSGVINMLDIPTIVLGGDLVTIADHLLPTIEHELRTNVLTARWHMPNVHTVWFDPAPVATGAAIAGLSQVLEQPADWL